MKIECIKDRFGEAVMRAEKVSGKNPTLPALGGIYLKAENNTVSIKATNLDLAISITIPTKVIEPGEVVIPAQILSSFVSSLKKDKNINIETEGQVILIKTGDTEATIKTLPTEDFPIIPLIKDDEAFSMPSKDLILGLKSVYYAAAVGSMKPELSSVCVAYGGDGLIFAATDSFRLAERKMKVKKMPHFKQILIPQKNISEILRVFDSIDEDISISIEENQATFFGGGVYLTSRIIDGVFPDYKQIIPKETSSEVIVLKQDLVDSLKTALIFSDSFNQLNLKVSSVKKLFEIQSKNQNIGENKHQIQAVVKGEELSISVNHRYFTDCFQSIPSDSINLRFSGQGKPILMEGVSDKTFMYLVMPMNKL
ncbi:MAG: DNA polymerase III, beta subunit [Parcubacteria bacterium C7867-005]|nr:MAG: DNA polymerase III, beta subunit [Parcubacteria bacterium C7867-005]